MLPCRPWRHATPTQPAPAAILWPVQPVHLTSHPTDQTSPGACQQHGSAACGPCAPRVHLSFSLHQRGAPCAAASNHAGGTSWQNSRRLTRREPLDWDTGELNRAIIETKTLRGLLALLDILYHPTMQCRVQGMDVVNVATLANRISQAVLDSSSSPDGLTPSAIGRLPRCLAQLSKLAYSFRRHRKPRQLSTLMHSLSVLANTVENLCPAQPQSTLDDFAPQPRQQPTNATPTDPAVSDQVWLALTNNQHLQPPSPSLPLDTTAASLSADNTNHHHYHAPPIPPVQRAKHVMYCLLTEFCTAARDVAVTPKDITHTLYALAHLGLPLYPAHAQQAELLKALLHRSVPEFNSRDHSMALWSVATLGLKPGRAWLEAVIQLTTPMLADSFSTQSLSNSAWALSVMGCVPDHHWVNELLRASHTHMHTCTHQELANLAWAVPTFMHADSPSQLRSALSVWLERLDTELVRRLEQQQQQQGQVDKQQQQQHQHQPWAQHEDQHEQLGSHRSHVPPPTTTTTAQPVPAPAAAAGKRLLPEDVACILRCMAVSGHVLSPHLMVTLCSHIKSQLLQHQDVRLTPTTADVAASSKHVGQNVHRNGSSGFRVVSGDVGGVQGGVGSSWGTNVQAQCTVLWSLARMGVVPPVDLVQLLVLALGTCLHTCNTQDLSSCLYALAMLNVQLPEKWLVRFFEASRQLMPGCSPAQLAALLLGLARLKIRPDRVWIEHALCQVTYQMQLHLARWHSQTRNNPLSDTASLSLSQGTITAGTHSSRDSVRPSSRDSSNWSSSSSAVQIGLLDRDHQDNTIEAEPLDDIDALAMERSASKSQCTSKELASLWGALGRLGYCPPASCIKSLCAVTAVLLHTFSNYELVVMLTAQAKLGLKTKAQGRWQQVQGRAAGVAGLAAADARVAAKAGVLPVTLDEVLPDDWSSSVCQVVASRAASLPPKDLHSVLQSLSAMNMMHGFNTAMAAAQGQQQQPPGMREHSAGVGAVARGGMRAGARQAQAAVGPLQVLAVGGCESVGEVVDGDDESAATRQVTEAYGLASLSLLAPRWLVKQRLRGMALQHQARQKRQGSRK